MIKQSIDEIQKSINISKDPLEKMILSKILIMKNIQDDKEKSEILSLMKKQEDSIQELAKMKKVKKTKDTKPNEKKIQDDIINIKMDERLKSEIELTKSFSNEIEKPYN